MEDGAMDALSSPLFREVQDRVGPRPWAGGVCQLLAASGDLALLRDRDGFRLAPLQALPTFLDLSPIIDHTLLKPQATRAEAVALVEEARAYGFASVCVNPSRVELCAGLLQGSPVRVCTVVGFPLGATTSTAKAEEAREAVASGADEVDMVLSVGWAREGNWDAVRREMALVRAAVPTSCLKIILETCLLTPEEKTVACRIAAEEGLDFVKTSTGFSTGGATEADVILMRQTVGSRCGVKASGGIRTYHDALRMVLAGATRLGLSSSIFIVNGQEGAGSGY